MREVGTVKRILGLLGHQKIVGVREQEGVGWKARSDIEKWGLEIEIVE